MRAAQLTRGKAEALPLPPGSVDRMLMVERRT